MAKWQVRTASKGPPMITRSLNLKSRGKTVGNKRVVTARPGSAPRKPSSVLGTTLGLVGADVATVIAKIQLGFPVSVLDTFQKSTGLPLGTIAALVRLPSRTLTRRKAEGRLQPDESERLFRLATIVDKAIALFEGNRDAAIQWLQRPQPALAGSRPIDFVSTEIGAREVEDLIGRLEHGVFT
jgi:putative toxin-antitoxin system antitoxin component (TIGR02293 family)